MRLLLILGLVVGGLPGSGALVGSGLAADVRRVPADYATIQAAVDAALNGDCVLVAPGSYNESVVVQGTSLADPIEISIASEAGPQATTITGAGIAFLIQYGRNVEICGFTLRNNTVYGVQTRYSVGTKIRNNVIHDNASSGIDVPGSFLPNEVLAENNTIVANFYGILFDGGATLSANHNVVLFNTSTDIGCFGSSQPTLGCNLVGQGHNSGCTLDPTDLELACSDPLDPGACTVYPLFTDYALRDLRPGAGFPSLGSCGTVGALFTACPTAGSVSGLVAADCPAPGTGLLGARVDVYTVGAGLLTAGGTTGSDGSYTIEDLAPGDYVVTLVVPLGYTTSAEEVQISIGCGGSASVDFGLSCQAIEADPRTIGFWKHQFGVARGGNGQGQIDAATLCSYLDDIAFHFHDHTLNPVTVYSPPPGGQCSDKLAAASALLNLQGKIAMIDRARQQLTALLLNVAAGRLSLQAVVSADDAVLSQAITFCDNQIDDPQGDHELAKTICDEINNGRLVAAGKIPLATPIIAYPIKLPGRTVLYSNVPNPFNPATTIGFDLAASGRVQLGVYDIAGRLVRTLLDEDMQAGRDHSVVWNGLDDQNRRVGSGVYFYRLDAAGERFTKKMVVMK